MKQKTIKFIDLFAGLGGIRLGFEQAFQKRGFTTECVLTSEIKPHACEALKQNFGSEYNVGDITQVEAPFIPDFDYLLAGFPCQPFSAGGKRQGFLDTRGTLFFEIEKILREKQPSGFILENVEGLVKHDLEKNSDSIGNTLKTILKVLQQDLNYSVKWRVIDALDFGIPQSRKRIYIVGSKRGTLDFEEYQCQASQLSDILESGLEPLKTKMADKLLKKFTLNELLGKSIKDKRGGSNNIHSWQIGMKGRVSKVQSELLSQIFKERRRKHWAAEIGIDWMDGMPLTYLQIKRFFSDKKLEDNLDDLVEKGYLKFEYPKKLVVEKVGKISRKYRTYDETKPKGYNIVAGKLSFEINKIMDPADIAPTLVATDMARLVVPDGGKLRRLSAREGLRLCGYPESYQLNLPINQVYDLLGNTVAVPVVKYIATQLCNAHQASPEISETQAVVTSSLTPV